MRRVLFWKLVSLMDLISRNQETGATDILSALDSAERGTMTAMLEEVIIWLQDDDFRQALGAIPLKPGMPTATEAIRKAREES